MSRAKRRSAQERARQILAELNFAPGNLGGQILAASDDAMACLWALAWMSEKWVEVEGAFRRLFMEHREAWLAQLGLSKSASVAEALEVARAAEDTMRIMGCPPTAELLEKKARLRELAVAELRRRGFGPNGEAL